MNVKNLSVLLLQYGLKIKKEVLSMKEYIYESVVREVKFEQVDNKTYNVYTSESCFGYDWELFAIIEVVVNDINDYSMLDDIQEGIIRNFFYNETSFSDETSNGFTLCIHGKIIAVALKWKKLHLMRAKTTQ